MIMCLIISALCHVYISVMRADFERDFIIICSLSSLLVLVLHACSHKRSKITALNERERGRESTLARSAISIVNPFKWA